MVTGTLTYRERIALPTGAVAEVRLIDASLQDVAAPIIAQTVIELEGRQVPIHFELRFDTSAIQPRRTYAVRAAIRSGERLLFTTTTAYPVITRGNPTRVELLLERVVQRPDTARSDRTSSPTLENTYWKLIVLGGLSSLVAQNIPEPNLRLLPSQRQARGSTGCNSFQGSYALNGDSIRFGPLTSTQRACVDPEMERQERIFLEALAAVRSWRIEGDTLLFAGEPGALARFVAVYLR